MDRSVMPSRFELATERAMTERRDALLTVPAGDVARIARLQGEHAGLAEAKRLYRQVERQDELEDDDQDGVVVVHAR